MFNDTHVMCNILESDCKEAHLYMHLILMQSEVSVMVFSFLVPSNNFKNSLIYDRLLEIKKKK